MAAGLILSQRIVSLAPPPTVPDLLFVDFNDGTLGDEFTDLWGDGSLTVVNDATGSGKGKYAQVRYRGNGPGADINRSLTWFVHSNHPAHFFFSGDLYIPANTAQLTNGLVQRKLIYFQGDSNAGIRADYIVKIWGDQVGTEYVTSAEDIAANGLATFTGDAWHKFEMEFQINSAWNVADGLWRVWFDGALIYEKLNYKVIAPASNPGVPLRFDFFLMGVQREGFAGDGAIDESRFWDNIGFATRRIGA